MEYPNPETMKGIWADTYRFYLKWIAVKEIDWDICLDESRELEQKYPYQICRNILIDTIKVIEANAMNKEE